VRAGNGPRSRNGLGDRADGCPGGEAADQCITRAIGGAGSFQRTITGAVVSTVPRPSGEAGGLG
jgi:hypothetical protein